MKSGAWSPRFRPSTTEGWYLPDSGPILETAFFGEQAGNTGALSVTLDDATVSAAATGPQVVAAGPTPAGSNRKRRYFVEIDGQHFIVNTPDEARALLERAHGLAEQAAEDEAERIVSAALPRIRALGKVEPVALAPRIKTDVQTPEIERIKAEIERIYAQAAQAAELRLLMQRQDAEDDDEAEELLLMGIL